MRGRWGFVLLAAALIPSPALAQESATDWAKEREFWSFRAPVASSPPAVKDASWPSQPIDAFILARLEARGLKPSPAVDRAVFLRRVTFDLTGLPPTPEEVEAFLRDPDPAAYERVVDRLLASPRFGERMASLWLPLARYAEDQAHQVGTDTKYFYPNAFKYREWVIDAFNKDIPYDRFIRLQLAADKVEPAELNALGFIGLGPKYYNRDRLDVMAEEWEDRVDTVTRALLGLTVACARCHDHKFEPLTQRDYYALAGVFASTKLVNRGPDGKAIPENTKEGAKTPPPPADVTHVVEDQAAPQDLAIFIRGDVERKGPVAPRGFLRLLSEGDPVAFKEGSGRKELADAIADRRNPLTARVWVNRLWGMLFGRPIVPTPSNFGRSGRPPSHPELLDDLAVRFMEQGWSTRKALRDLALSSTYRQSSRGVDPANELFGRMDRRRMTAEQWRDAVLFVSGRLDFAGGKSLELDDPANRRRTVHARVSRLKLNDYLALFDYPDANIHAEGRHRSITPLQKLFALNSPFMIDQAKALAARLAEERDGTDEARIRRAHLLLFSRLPEPSETRRALEFLARPSSSTMSRWEQYAQALLASNEMIYVD